MCGNALRFTKHAQGRKKNNPAQRRREAGRRGKSQKPSAQARRPRDKDADENGVGQRWGIKGRQCGFVVIISALIVFNIAVLVTRRGRSLDTVGVHCRTTATTTGVVVVVVVVITTTSTLCGRLSPRTGANNGGYSGGGVCEKRVRNCHTNRIVGGWLFPHFHFVLSDPELPDMAVAYPRCAGRNEVDSASSDTTTTASAARNTRNHMVVVTRSVDSGIHETLVVKSWLYLKWAFLRGGGNNKTGTGATTPEGTKWILRVDADTFVIVLRLLRSLASFNPDEPLLIGSLQFGIPDKLRHHVLHHDIFWPNGGAGIAIS